MCYSFAKMKLLGTQSSIIMIYHMETLKILGLTRKTTTRNYYV